MDIRQLKTFVAIAEQGTFAAAADIVHITPSAVSQQMLALEAEIGTSLFNRDTRPPSLNLQGLQLLETSRRIIRLLQDTQNAIDGRRSSGHLMIGSVRTSTTGLLPLAIVALREKYPNLEIKMRVGMSNALISDVLAGNLDLAIVADNLRMPQSLRWTPFIREPLLIIAPAGTPQMPAREMLETMPFLRFRASVPLANMIDTELARQAIHTLECAEIDTISSIVECVAAGLGVSVVPDIALQNAPDSIVRLPFGDPQIFRHIGLIRPVSSPKDIFSDEVHSHLAALAGVYGLPLTGDRRSHSNL